MVFDVGGTLELFDGKAQRDNVVLEPTEDALLAKLTEVGVCQWYSSHVAAFLHSSGAYARERAHGEGWKRLCRQSCSSLQNCVQVECLRWYLAHRSWLRARSRR